MTFLLTVFVVGLNGDWEFYSGRWKRLQICCIITSIWYAYEFSICYDCTEWLLKSSLVAHETYTSTSIMAPRGCTNCPIYVFWKLLVVNRPTRRNDIRLLHTTVVEWRSFVTYRTLRSDISGWRWLRWGGGGIWASTCESLGRSPCVVIIDSVQCLNSATPHFFG